MKISAKTDIGSVRKQNQDSYAAGELPGGISWAVLCDGMGGAAAGAVASTMAVRMISEKISSSCSEQMTENFIRNILVSVIESANAYLYDVSRSNPEYKGMGTTAVALIAMGDSVCISHVGDSRAYKITPSGDIKQITRDHSVVQQLVERGDITPEQAKTHPERHIITRAVGVDEKVSVDFCRESLDEGDIILLCSDGLSGYVDDKDIAAATANGDYCQFADRLVNMAIENGGGDNITVVLISK